MSFTYYRVIFWYLVLRRVNIKQDLMQDNKMRKVAYLGQMLKHKEILVYARNMNFYKPVFL